MAINQIPGVGPTNADIATAVAAPSAATIAAAVAAPSAATIATAVGAPTRAQIQSDIGTYAPSPNGWTYITSNTSLGSATITFSSLSGYKTYKILIHGIYQNATSDYLCLRINGDTNGNYGYYFPYENASSSMSAFRNAGNTYVSLTANSSNWNGITGEVTIENATLSAPKRITGITRAAGGDLSAQFPGLAIYYTTSSVSSISILNRNGGTYYTSVTGGGFYLYGAN